MKKGNLTSWLWAMGLAAMMTICVAGCGDDDNETLSEVEIEQAKELLNGDIVVSAHVSVNNVDKTLLPGGAPSKFTVTHGDGDKLSLWQEDFQLGKMPFPIALGIDLTLGPVLSLEADDLKGEGWIRFYGKRGVISIDGKRPASTVDTNASGDGTTVTGYLNILTGEIQFQISYAMMVVELNAPRQELDPGRAANFEAEKAQYEKELEEYKKEHGLE